MIKEQNNRLVGQLPIQCDHQSKISECSYRQGQGQKHAQKYYRVH